MPEQLRPLEGASLASRAYEALRDAILQMTLEPGEALVEQRLAEALGTSKTPIRQALHRLEQTGLVKGVPNRGYFVSDLTLRDAREILEIRAVLEGLAARHATTKVTADELERMQDVLVEAGEALRTEELARCAELGHEFHRMLMRKADNTRLSLMIEMLNDQFHRIRLLSSQVPGRLPHSVEEHASIFDAVKVRDEDLAERRMRDHLLQVYADIAQDEELDDRIHRFRGVTESEALEQRVISPGVD